MNMPEHICPRCRAPIPVDSSTQSGSERQCPRCLLRPPWDKPHPVAITLGPGQSFLPPSIEELAGHISGYEVQALIGQGGMGAVYLGRQKSLDRPVAIKILPPQIAERSGFRERFTREGRALAKLNHPNIVAVYDFGQAGPYAMLVMELVEGANLREVLAQGRLSPAEALEIIPQLCEALSYAHDEGVVHRDIKPENLLFDSRGRLKITDFGLAKLVSLKTIDENADAATTAQSSAVPDPTQGVVGTVHYMAPEQLENPRSVDHRADIYALGVVFYEMLTGELPIGRFEPPSHLVRDPDPSKPSKLAIDVRLDEVVLRALEKQPEKRYGSASALMHDIDEIEKAPSRAQAGAAHPEGHRGRVRDTVHWAGETAGTFAASSMQATGQWVSQARQSWLKNPRVEFPAYLSIGCIAIGVIGAFVLGDGPGRGEIGFAWFVLAAIFALVFARVSLTRESEPEFARAHPLLVSRILLGVIYTVIAIPLLTWPIITTIGVWSQVHGFPRAIGELGWMRDWVQLTSTATMMTATFYLLLLGIHVAFPKLLSTVFRPFVGRLSRSAAVAIAVLLLASIGAGFFMLQQMPYLSYAPGVAVAEEDWGKLSPNDLRRMQTELGER